MTIPRIEQFDALEVLGGTASSRGYRAPAGWAPVEAVWLSRPTNTVSWPGCTDRALEQFDAYATKLREAAEVRVADELDIPTADSWMRDTGPIFVVRNEAEPPGAKLPGVACHDFRFNCWGGKWSDWRIDDLVAQRVALRCGVPIWVHDVVLEGGAIDVNGRGDLLTTESCLLNPNRNPGLSRDELERKLAETLGVSRVIWLLGGYTGDDTDGHVDTVARFIAPDTVAVATAPESHPDHDVLEENRRRLAAAGLNIVELPTPAPRTHDYPADGYFPAGPRPVTQTYANFLFVNGVLFVPVYGDAADERALRVLDDAVPDHRIEPVRAEWLVVGGGSLHCLSMQQPAARR